MVIVGLRHCLVVMIIVVIVLVVDLRLVIGFVIVDLLCGFGVSSWCFLGGYGCVSSWLRLLVWFCMFGWFTCLLLVGFNSVVMFAAHFTLSCVLVVSLLAYVCFERWALFAGWFVLLFRWFLGYGFDA